MHFERIVFQIVKLFRRALVITLDGGGGVRVSGPGKCKPGCPVAEPVGNAPLVDVRGVGELGMVGSFCSTLQAVRTIQRPSRLTTNSTQKATIIQGTDGTADGPHPFRA
jgi:hypothetical protein